MQSILAASDRSSGSAALVRTAARIAAASGAELRLLHSTWPMRPGPLPHPAEDDSREAVRTFDELSGPVEVDLCDKPLREAVLDRCMDSPADLVVVGANDTPGGSLMAPHLDVVQIALRASGAVLVVRESLDWPPKRILIPVGEPDLRHGTLERAVRWLLASARPAVRPSGGGAPRELRVLHMAVGPRELSETGGELGRQIEGIEAATIREARIRLTRHVQREPGSVERALRRAEREETDLVVLRRHEPGSRSPDPGELLWLRMLSAARCSVLLLPRAPRAPASARPAGRGGSGPRPRPALTGGGAA